jgi:CBS domain-containing protein
MEIRELMTKDVCCCAATDSLRDIATLMKDTDYGCLPVCDSERLVGMITDRDVLLCAANGDQPLSKLSARDAMTSNITRCRPQDSVEEVERLTRTAQIRRLPVVDDSGALTGIISLADFALTAGDQGQRDVQADDVATTLSGICRPRTVAA